MNIDLFIESNKGLIYKIASFFYGVDKEDLYQAGVLGILKAYRNYRDNSNVKFSSYAYEYIYGEMYNLASNKAIKINKQIRKINKLIEQAREILFQKNGVEPSNEELSKFLNVPVSLIEEALLMPTSFISLDNDENNLYECIRNRDEDIDKKILIDESLNNLSEDERNIIYSRYYEDLTQSEVARKLKMTQVKVSRYEKKSLSKMHEYMVR